MQALLARPLRRSPPPKLQGSSPRLELRSPDWKVLLRLRSPFKARQKQRADVASK